MQEDVSVNTLLDVIKENKSISTLSISYVNLSFDTAAVKRLITEHPALVELDLEHYKFMAADVVALIRQLKSLEHFKFMMPEAEHSKLKLQLKVDYRKWITLICICCGPSCFVCLDFNRQEQQQ